MATTRRPNAVEGLTTELLSTTSRLPRSAQYGSARRPQRDSKRNVASRVIIALYHNLLLYGPALYTNRVAQALEDTDAIQPSVAAMALAAGDPTKFDDNLAMHQQNIVRFKVSWSEFIDSLVREWESLNLITALLLAAILTLLQIQTAGDDPIIRALALNSLVCAIMGLVYGCMFSVRFRTLTHTHQAMVWGEYVKESQGSLLWDFPTFLSMPVVWSSWSLILFATSILCFLWRTTNSSAFTPSGETPLNNLPPSANILMICRIVTSAVFGLGVIILGFVILSLSQFGSKLNRSWRMMKDRWNHVDVHDDAEPQPAWTPHYGHQVSAEAPPMFMNAAVPNPPMISVANPYVGDRPGPPGRSDPPPPPPNVGGYATGPPPAGTLSSPWSVPATRWSPQGLTYFG